jgi:hypothetical protein
LPPAFFTSRLHYFAWICENRVKWGTKVLHIIITIILL